MRLDSITSILHDNIHKPWRNLPYQEKNKTKIHAQQFLSSKNQSNKKTAEKAVTPDDDLQEQ